MSQTPRKKPRRTPKKANSNLNSLLNALKAAREHRETFRSEAEDQFQKQVEQTRNCISKYNRRDVAIALNVSDLWPANSGSPIKHIFAWGVLVGCKNQDPARLPIASYTDFKLFIEELYEIWPEFPMLEDFTPESDWGQTKTLLGKKFVPVFYGSCIERTPDFIEAFRITYAHLPEALAHIDLAISLQASIIDAVPNLKGSLSRDSSPGYVEIPTEEFWVTCRPALLNVSSDISKWKKAAGDVLEIDFGDFEAPLSWAEFGNAVMQGMVLPYLAIRDEGFWVPMSLRSAPSVVLDHWANKDGVKVTSRTHQRLAYFIAQRFQHLVAGPLLIQVGDKWIEDLAISCIVSSSSGVYVICACDHDSISRYSRAASWIFNEVKRGAPVKFRLVNGPTLISSRKDDLGPRADELKILLVVTQAGTAFGTIEMPKKPARILPLTDLITIFDNLKDLSELDPYWSFVDSQRDALNILSSGPADLFASYKDTHGVLVEGAIAPQHISLNPHWGTSWRFDSLSEFWAMAPSFFPDGSQGWWLSLETKGVVGLHSRHHNAVAYSIELPGCTVQTYLDVRSGLDLENAKLLDLFSQVIADCISRNKEHLSDIHFFQEPHVVFNCMVDTSNRVIGQEEPQPLKNFQRVVVSGERNPNDAGEFALYVSTRAVLAGLNSAKDGSFEVRCLVEAMEVCLSSDGFELPKEFTNRFKDRASESARYHLKVSDQHVDVPGYIVPVTPTPRDYKLARKQLAKEILALGLVPGQYELAEAKLNIDLASASFREYIEDRLATFDKRQLVRAFIEQQDATLATERNRIERARLSLAHAVEYDRHEAIEHARREFGDIARHYRYLVEKVVSSSITGKERVTDEVLRELVALVDWYMVLTGASDVLHNGIDVGGVVIDKSYIPEVYYSDNHDERNKEFARHTANFRLGLGVKTHDVVEANSKEILTSDDFKQAFLADTGFELESLIAVLAVLSQALRNGFGSQLSLSYSSTFSQLTQTMSNNISRLSLGEAEKIIEFLTLSETGILKLAEREIIEVEVPYWEHSKRTHRYAIRPLIRNGEELRWGAETASRALNIWITAVRDGYLPADFKWKNVEPIVARIKAGIERQLEHRTEDIFLRHTSYVRRGVDFYQQFPDEQFDDVGDFDVFAYWPAIKLIMIVECKYNKPPYTIKDGRRLRDTIFGRSEGDKRGQLTKMVRRRQFLETNQARLLQLLGWPQAEGGELRKMELYVSRDVYFCMFNPPYDIPTNFVRVEELDSWITTNVSKIEALGKT